MTYLNELFNESRHLAFKAALGEFWLNKLSGIKQDSTTTIEYYTNIIHSESVLYSLQRCNKELSEKRKSIREAQSILGSSQFIDTSSMLAKILEHHLLAFPGFYYYDKQDRKRLSPYVSHEKTDELETAFSNLLSNLRKISEIEKKLHKEALMELDPWLKNRNY